MEEVMTLQTRTGMASRVCVALCIMYLCLNAETN